MTIEDFSNWANNNKLDTGAKIQLIPNKELIELYPINNN